MGKQRPARILVIEDESIIALTLQDLLVEAGFEVACVTGRLQKALALIEDAGCDAAIVDANLGGVSTSPAALALAARGVPFIVLSGYSSEQAAGRISCSAVHEEAVSAGQAHSRAQGHCAQAMSSAIGSPDPVHRAAGCASARNRKSGENDGSQKLGKRPRLIQLSFRG
jgi:CheY-like chemotaxis protein